MVGTIDMDLRYLPSDICLSRPSRNAFRKDEIAVLYVPIHMRWDMGQDKK